MFYVYIVHLNAVIISFMAMGLFLFFSRYMFYFFVYNQKNSYHFMRRSEVKHFVVLGVDIIYCGNQASDWQSKETHKPSYRLYADVARQIVMWYCRSKTSTVYKKKQLGSGVTNVGNIYNNSYMCAHLIVNPQLWCAWYTNVHLVVRDNSKYIYQHCIHS